MQQIGFIVFPGFEMMSLAASSVFECANLSPNEHRYKVRIFSEKGGSIVSSNGLSVNTEAWQDPSFDTLIVGASFSLDTLPTGAGLLSFIRASAKVSRRVASICIGSFVLADAGVLDGRRATTHWAVAGEFSNRFPQVSMDGDRIYVVDDKIWTSAGMAAGIDLALAMVEEDLGAEVARAVAKILVLYHRRAGGQPQQSALLELEPKSDRIQSALTFVKNNLSKPISVEDLAAASRLSSRHFGRVFHSETGHSPAKAIEKLRVEAARMMLEGGRHSMEAVAEETGFSDRERMRRAFVRGLRAAPAGISADRASG